MAHNPSSSNANEFMPTDGELIILLTNKLTGKPLPTEASNNIHQCDLFGTDKNPWEIWEAFGGNNGRSVLYFFTTRKWNLLNSSNPYLVQNIGSGRWVGVNISNYGRSKRTKQFTSMKRFLHFENSGTNHDGAWILHEYSLLPSVLKNPLCSNYVLCKLMKNERDSQQETGQEETRQSTRNEQGQPEDAKEPEDGDLDMSWPELFAWQLKFANRENFVQEEDNPLIPNSFHKDLLDSEVFESITNEGVDGGNSGAQCPNAAEVAETVRATDHVTDDPSSGGMQLRRSTRSKTTNQRLKGHESSQ